jgi:hypothetical protein
LGSSVRLRLQIPVVVGAVGVTSEQVGSIITRFNSVNHHSPLLPKAHSLCLSFIQIRTIQRLANGDVDVADLAPQRWHWTLLEDDRANNTRPRHYDARSQYTRHYDASDIGGTKLSSAQHAHAWSEQSTPDG